MDFSLTEEQARFKEAVVKFSQQELNNGVIERERREEIRAKKKPTRGSTDVRSNKPPRPNPCPRRRSKTTWASDRNAHQDVEPRGIASACLQSSLLLLLCFINKPQRQEKATNFLRTWLRILYLGERAE